MEKKVTCIALRGVRYGDDGVMLSLWSREAGFISAAVRMGRGREAQRRKALLMPPMAFEAVAHVSAGSEVVRLSDVRSLSAMASLSMSPVRMIVGTFIAEVLSLLLRKSGPDEPLSAFIFERWLGLASASGRELANFHIVFLSRMTRFLGIEPDVSTWRRGYCFNMREAVFSPSMPVSGAGIDAEGARVAAMLLRMDFNQALRLPVGRALRCSILDKILEYYSLHLAPMHSLRSYSVLREMFA